MTQQQLDRIYTLFRDVEMGYATVSRGDYLRDVGELLMEREQRLEREAFDETAQAQARQRRRY